MKKPKAGQIWKSKHTEELIQLIEIIRIYPITVWSIKNSKAKIEKMEEDDLVMFYDLEKPDLTPQSHRLDKVKKSKFKR